ncbi:MAG: hypothetical protein HYX24_02545 [Candidatus Aenigmarchaeota archaeon]|nr:hypothetical protein [Candidatus Aenigmarchaeota archaeon]
MAKPYQNPVRGEKEDNTNTNGNADDEMVEIFKQMASRFLSEEELAIMKFLADIKQDGTTQAEARNGMEGTRDWVQASLLNGLGLTFCEARKPLTIEQAIEHIFNVELSGPAKEQEAEEGMEEEYLEGEQ